MSDTDSDPEFSVIAALFARDATPQVIQAEGDAIAKISVILTGLRPASQRAVINFISSRQDDHMTQTIDEQCAARRRRRIEAGLPAKGA